MVRRTRGRLPSKAAKGTTQRNVSKGTTAVQSKAHRRSGEGQGTTTQRRKTTDSRGLEPIPKAIAGRAPARQRFLRSRVLITGGAEGIGRGIALAFAAEGADVFVADIKAPSGADRKCEKGLAGSIRYFSCDAGVPEQVEAASKAAGPRDILINNVATQPEAPCHEHSLEDWMRALNVNLTSYFLFSKFCLPHMLKAGKGVIVNMASVQGLQSQPGIPGYAASKGGVLSLTRQLAMEYADKGIRVTAINPGTINTPLVSRILKLRGTTKAQAGAVYPMRRIGEIQEISNAVLFLASDEASFITAESLTVDGGIMGLGGWAQVA